MDKKLHSNVNHYYISAKQKHILLFHLWEIIFQKCKNGLHFVLLLLMDKKLNRIKEILVREGVSQKDLAFKLEKNEHTISNWCINKSQPHLKELYKIAEILDVEVCELLVNNKK